MDGVPDIFQYSYPVLGVLIIGCLRMAIENREKIPEGQFVMLSLFGGGAVMYMVLSDLSSPLLLIWGSILAIISTSTIFKTISQTKNCNQCISRMDNCQQNVVLPKPINFMSYPYYNNYTPTPLNQVYELRDRQSFMNMYNPTSYHPSVFAGVDDPPADQPVKRKRPAVLPPECGPFDDDDDDDDDDNNNNNNKKDDDDPNNKNNNNNNNNKDGGDDDDDDNPNNKNNNTDDDDDDDDGGGGGGGGGRGGGRGGGGRGDGDDDDDDDDDFDDGDDPFGRRKGDGDDGDDDGQGGPNDPVGFDDDGNPIGPDGKPIDQGVGVDGDPDGDGDGDGDDDDDDDDYDWKNDEMNTDTSKIIQTEQDKDKDKDDGPDWEKIWNVLLFINFASLWLISTMNFVYLRQMTGRMMAQKEAAEPPPIPKVPLNVGTCEELGGTLNQLFGPWNKVEQ